MLRLYAEFLMNRILEMTVHLKINVLLAVKHHTIKRFLLAYFSC